MPRARSPSALKTLRLGATSKVASGGARRRVRRQHLRNHYGAPCRSLVGQRITRKQRCRRGARDQKAKASELRSAQLAGGRPSTSTGLRSMRRAARARVPRGRGDGKAATAALLRFSRLNKGDAWRTHAWARTRRDFATCARPPARLCRFTTFGSSGWMGHERGEGRSQRPERGRRFQIMAGHQEQDQSGPPTSGLRSRPSAHGAASSSEPRAKIIDA